MWLFFAEPSSDLHTKVLPGCIQMGIECIIITM
ncbi:hypothetical protein DET1361 [Dehalococcoides mccartyi 195]|uniref:Uncharacterized protein n=1 Tax=Dehalococcoides mccartyi (strain ATCC BAA-2266 / KCTC 15142 / 195) TaxID=243164 RepID=Q3Z6S7_DEHM1|nr:hypothetical protein DET1361 [Dehalococcoides mccartyi 195]